MYSTLLRWMGIVGVVIQDLVPKLYSISSFIPLACKSTTFVVVIAKDSTSCTASMMFFNVPNVALRCIATVYVNLVFEIRAAELRVWSPIDGLSRRKRLAFSVWGTEWASTGHRRQRERFFLRGGIEGTTGVPDAFTLSHHLPHYPHHSCN